MTFLAATNNAHKFEELRRILKPMGHSLLTLREAGVAACPEETAATFEGNALIKAQTALSAGLPVIADDSGLEVEALGGAPGVYSARYAGPDATDAQRIEKLLSELRGLPEEKRGARFVCAVCCLFPDGRRITARGECPGRIAEVPGGSGGFGYDPVFREESTEKLFSELSGEEKDSVSHRGRALRQLRERLAAFAEKSL